MKKIGLKTKKTIASAVLMAAIAILAGLAGRLAVLGVTTDAMQIGWNDWMRNRNYEDSWTLSEHVGADLSSIVEYVGLKQLLEEEDGSLNLNRPALLVEYEDGSRTILSMQDLISKGEEYGIYLYRPSGGGVEIRESGYETGEEPVRVLWRLWNREDAQTGLAEDAWAVREERIRQLLLETPGEEAGFAIPPSGELEALSAEALLALLKEMPKGYVDAKILAPSEQLADWEALLNQIRQGLPAGADGTEAEEAEEQLLALKEELIDFLNLYRDSHTEEDRFFDLRDLTRSFLWNCLWSYYNGRYRLTETQGNLSWQIVLEEGEARRVYSDPNTPKGTYLSTDGMNAYYSYDSASQKMDCTLGEWSWLPHVALKDRTPMDYSRVTIVAGLDTAALSYEDSYSLEAASYAQYRGQVFGATGIIAGCLIVIAVTMVWLMFLSGHKEGVEGIYLNGYDRIPTELGACGIFLMIGGFSFGFLLVFEILTAYLSYQKDGISAPMLIGVLILEVLLAYLILWLGLYGLIRRLKAHTFWKNSVTARFLSWCMKPVRWCGGQARRLWNLLLNAGDTTWKTLSIFCVYFIVNFVWGTNIRYASALSLLMYLAFNGAVGVSLIWRASQMKRVYAGVKKIADGSLDYHLPLENLNGEARRLAMQINRINISLKNAIEDSVKNERMKTDLITNVSHDIKTPLTSIINYVDLLKREKIEDTRIQGYIKVLDKKSQRLKTLTEDLVEASRASSGTLKLSLEKINFVELINQTSGEFMDRFEAKNLAVIPNIPTESAFIMADGRYVWRILENLYRNAEKYAMPGTRVYIDVFEKFGRIFFVMKNVSQAPLNIKADELTERFIRGDVSRSTEGSGLGLSIAKDMTELMNGTFKIYLDGDLFRVTISFAVIQEKKTDLKEMEESIRRRMAEEEAKGAGKESGAKSGRPGFKATQDVRMDPEGSEGSSGMQAAWGLPGYKKDPARDLWDQLRDKLPRLPFGRRRKEQAAAEEETRQDLRLPGPANEPGGEDPDEDFYNP